MTIFRIPETFLFLMKNDIVIRQDSFLNRSETGWNPFLLTEKNTE